MAIKVNGTTVIDDSRNLVNIVSGAGSSTTYGAVGTYAFLYSEGVGIVDGTTHAGSNLKPAGFYWSGSLGNDASGAADLTKGGSTLSGTWRAMGRVYYNSSSAAQRVTLFVRIS